METVVRQNFHLHHFFRPPIVPTSYSNNIYEYYGAAKLRQLAIDEAAEFPKSRQEVEGLPRGISVSSARKSYIEEELGQRSNRDFSNTIDIDALT